MRKFIFSFVFFSFFCFIFAQDVDQAVGQTDYYPLVMDYVSNAFVLNGLDGTGLTAGQYFIKNNIPSSERVYPTSNYTGTYIPTSSQQNISYRIYKINSFAEFTDPQHIYVCHSSNPAFQIDSIDINSGASVVKNLGFTAGFTSVFDLPGDVDINISNLPQSTSFSVYFEIILFSFDGPYKTLREGVRVVTASELI